MLRQRLKYFFGKAHNEWEIGVSHSPIADFLKTDFFPEFKWLPQPPGVFRADPFGLEVQSNLYLFYEEYVYSKGYADIRCTVLDSRLNILDDRPALDTDYHLSFPWVFEYENAFWMLPEQCCTKTLTLYKAVEFPYVWKPESVLLELPVFDCQLFWYNNKWCMLYSVSGEQENSTTYVRFSDSLTGSWMNSPSFTIHTSDRGARAGGSVFSHENSLYRVTQNCTDRYGGSVILKQIHSLTNSELVETEIREITDKSPFSVGFHTLSSAGNFTLADRRRPFFDPKSSAELWQTIKSKF